MKKLELREIIREEILNLFEATDPWTGQGEMFNIPTQYNMTKAATEAYNVWDKAIKKKYKGKYVLYPNKRISAKSIISFDLKHSDHALHNFIKIYKDGKVHLPISFYRLNFEDKPNWMHMSNSASKRALTYKDFKSIYNGLEERP